MMPSLDAGTELARYRVDGLIGAGGMGEVYAALDMQLGRRVALKILPLSSASEERIARFVREAEAASALNHPAIVSVFESGSASAGGDPIRFIAMELVDGETLAEWLRGKHDARRRIEVLAAIADGLARAHSGGIVHRDLKPANILIARGGYPKIADFGVAKLLERGSRARQDETAPDALLGTSAYMSPEQVVGAAVDARADVFSFGCVAYEVLTGRAAFRRGNSVETMHAILNDVVSLDDLDPPLRRVVRRCLAKDPDDRYQSMRDVALDLRETLGDREPAAPPSRSRLFLLCAVLAALIVAAIVVNLQKPRAAPRPAAPAATVRMERLTNSGHLRTGAVSRDGKFAAYVTDEDGFQTVWLKQLATGTIVRAVPKYDGFYVDLQVSPDNDYIYFARSTRTEPNVVDLYRVPVIGGDVRKIASDTEFDFSISPDGNFVVFCRFNARDRIPRLTVADVNSGAETELLRRDPPDMIGGMRWMPNGNEIAFGLTTIVGGKRDNRLVPFGLTSMVGGKRDNRLVAIDIHTRKTRRLDRVVWRTTANWRAVSSFAWLNDGTLVLSAGARNEPMQLWIVPPNGMPRKITTDLSMYFVRGVTDDGIVAVRFEAAENIWLASADGSARPRAVTAGPDSHFGRAGLTWLDSTHVLTTTFEGDRPSLKILDVETGEMRPFARGSGYWWPRLSPDGQRLVYGSDESRSSEIWSCDAATCTERRQLTDSGRTAWPSFFPDGQSLAYLAGGQIARRVSITGQDLGPLTNVPTNTPVVSPDGKWLLAHFRQPDGSMPLWRTGVMPLGSKAAPRYFDVPLFGGGAMHGWAPDSKGFYLRDIPRGSGSNLFYQPIGGGPARQVTHFDSGEIYAFDVSRDGKSFALSRGDPTTDLVLVRDFR